MDLNILGQTQGTSDSFKFKYVAEEELLRIVRKVRRERRKEQDALRWNRFVEEREKCAQTESSHGVSETCLLQEPATKGSLCNTCDSQVNTEKYEDLRQQENPSMPLKSDTAAEEKVAQSPRLKLSTQIDNHLSSRESRSLQRIAVLRYRISLALDSILGMIQCQPAEPDGPDDLERRRTRINEFLSRFSRNYLFQLRIQVAELRRQIVCCSLETPGRHTEHQALMQKFVSAHQTAVQSLQAYLTQLPTSIHLRNIFGKLQDLLRYLCDLSSLKTQLESHACILDGLGEFQEKDEVYEKCQELISFLEDKQAGLEEASLSARASSPRSTRGSVSLRLQHQPRTLRYQGNVLHGSWKKSITHLARQKFGPPSSLHSSASPHAEKSSNNEAGNHNSDDMKELLLHMHDVLCSKATENNLKKKKKRNKQNSFLNRCCKKTSSDHKSYNQVQNLSSNVQLVITRHQDSDSDEYRTVATDTLDLNHSQPLGGRKKNKKVGWVEPDITNNSNSDVCLEQAILEENHAKGTRSSTNTSSVGCQDSLSWSEQRVEGYRNHFHLYKNQLKNPKVDRWCDSILDSVFQDIAKELEPSFLLEKMYNLEFKE